MSNFNHPYNTVGAFNRLIAEYQKYDTLYIGFDFDNTVWNYDKYKDNYADNQDAVNQDMLSVLKACKSVGMTLCLWTSSPDEKTTIYKAYLCEKWGIKPDYINESPLNPGGIKPHFTILLDDRAGLEQAVQMVSKLVVMISKGELPKK